MKQSEKYKRLIYFDDSLWKELNLKNLMSSKNLLKNSYMIGRI